MSEDATGSGENVRKARRRVVLAFLLAASGAGVGALAAIVAVTQGASTAVSLALMGAFMVSGVAAALVLAHRATRPGVEAPPTLLERQLSARYGVRVRRLATHVWDIDGELVEATLNPSTGYLTSGGRELRL